MENWEYGIHMYIHNFYTLTIEFQVVNDCRYSTTKLTKQLLLLIY